MSWAPDAATVGKEIPDRDVDNLGIAWAIEAAVVDVVSEVGNFDATRVINPDADPTDRVTLGDLAREAAAARAAQLLEEGHYPEQQSFDQTVGPAQANRLLARYRDRLERLRGWIARLGAGGVNSRLLTGSVTLTLPAVRGWQPDVEHRPPC